MLPSVNEVQTTSAPPAPLVNNMALPGETAAPEWPQYGPTTSTSAAPPFIPPQGFDMTPSANFGDATNPMMSGMMSQAEFAGFAPELGLQMPFDPEGLFSIGNMLHDGIFSMPGDEGNFFPG